MFEKTFKLKETEIEIIGSWIKKNGKVQADENCERIQKLLLNYFFRIVPSKEYGDWKVLYFSPDDNALWELTYPQSYLHGGGPPALYKIDENEAHKKFDFQSLTHDPWLE